MSAFFHLMRLLMTNRRSTLVYSSFRSPFVNQLFYIFGLRELGADILAQNLKLFFAVA